MKRSCLLTVLSLVFIFSHAQSFKKVPISNSGCTLYTYCDFGWGTGYTEDSSRYYVSECETDGLTYGIFCIKLRIPNTDLDRAESSLVNYLDYLKTRFKITKSAGYGKGHRLNKNENTRGVLDYWEDADKNNWKIKGWTNGKYIGVLYGYSATELPESKLNTYLDGFRFPGM